MEDRDTKSEKELFLSAAYEELLKDRIRSYLFQRQVVTFLYGCATILLIQLLLGR